MNADSVQQGGHLGHVSAAHPKQYSRKFKLRAGKASAMLNGCVLNTWCTTTLHG